MSIFSGKCDLKDSLDISGFEKIKNSKIYISKEGGFKPLNIIDETSLVPYYPYIILASAYDRDKGYSVIHLSSESFVDREEREILNMYLNDILKIYKRCKRKKEVFDIANTVEKVSWCLNKDIIQILTERVAEMGLKANIEGIHLPGKDYYRQQLVNEMLRYGLNPSDWGYERFIKEASYES